MAFHTRRHYAASRPKSTQQQTSADMFGWRYSLTNHRRTHLHQLTWTDHSVVSNCVLVLGGTTVLSWNRVTSFLRYQYRRGHGTTVVRYRNTTNTAVLPYGTCQPIVSRSTGFCYLLIGARWCVTWRCVHVRLAAWSVDVRTACCVVRT